jgi:hypothetical protein
VYQSSHQFSCTCVQNPADAPPVPLIVGHNPAEDGCQTIVQLLEAALLQLVDQYLAARGRASRIVFGLVSGGPSEWQLLLFFNVHGEARTRGIVHVDRLGKLQLNNAHRCHCSERSCFPYHEWGPPATMPSISRHACALIPIPLLLTVALLLLPLLLSFLAAAVHNLHMGPFQDIGQEEQGVVHLLLWCPLMQAVFKAGQ